MAYINKKKIKQQQSRQSIESIKTGDWIKVTGLPALITDPNDPDYLTENGKTSFDPFYARLLGICNDQFALYVYDQANGLAGWRGIPVDTELCIRKLSLKEENMLPTDVRLCSYVAGEDWIDYRHTNFVVQLVK